MFRYFEELLNKSIHVIIFVSGKRLLVPDHIPPYIWDPPYQEHIVVFESIKNVYGKTICKYKVLTRKGDNSPKLSTRDDAVRMLIREKANMSLLPSILESDRVVSQILDRKGKCRICFTDDNNEHYIFTRPYCALVIRRQECFLENHVEKINRIKALIGVKQVNVSKCSIKSFCYFRDNDSFFVWCQNRQKIGFIK